MSEVFLQRLMSLFVSSHYKVASLCAECSLFYRHSLVMVAVALQNSPNDLQLMSDAPAHMIFVLLGPVTPGSTELPDILCAVQVCLEGQISKDSVKAALSRGQRASGDLIPWTLAQQVKQAMLCE